MCKETKLADLKALKHKVRAILPNKIFVKTNGFKLIIYETKKHTFNIKIWKSFKKVDIDIEKELEIIRNKINYVL